MASPPPDALAMFMGLVLVLALCGLTVSGHFPAEARDPRLQTTIGKVTLWATIAVALLVAIAAIVLAWRRLPLYAAIIGGGAMLLIAPQLLRPLPDSFVNGRRGLLVFAALGLALTLLAERCVA
jgi:hypothetical protein